MTKRLVAVIGLALLIVLVSVGVVAIRNASPPPVHHIACPGGVAIASNESIQHAIDGSKSGTKFCLARGTYEISSNIHPKDGDKLIGSGMDRTFLKGTGAAIVIDAEAASDVVVAEMDISGGSGTRACRPKCGSGFSGGSNNMIDSVRFHDNVNHGIGGSGPNLVVMNSVFDHNGSSDFEGCCGGGIKGGTGFTIKNSRLFSNIGNGIWCDAGCTGGMKAYNNTIFDNARDGIRYEHSSGGAIIRGNTVRNNNMENALGGHGGITNVAAQNARIIDNKLGGNKHAGIAVVSNRRGVSANVVVANNSLNGDLLKGCNRGVVCKNNH